MRSETATQAAPTADTTLTTDAGADSKELPEEDLVRLHEMLERGAIEDARAWAKEMERQWPENEAVRHYIRVLAPPRVSVRSGHRGLSRQRERAWLREHARRYPGQWLAVLADQLIAADPDLNTVLTAVRETPGAQRALVHFQPGTPD